MLKYIMKKKIQTSEFLSQSLEREKDDNWNMV